MWVDLFVWLNIIKTYHTAVAFLQFDCNLLNVDFKHFLCYFAFHFFWKHVLSFIWIEFVCCPYCDCTWHLSSVYRISFYTNYYNVNLVFDFLVHSGSVLSLIKIYDDWIKCWFECLLFCIGHFRLHYFTKRGYA